MLSSIRGSFIVESRIIRRSALLTVIIVVLIFSLDPGRFASDYPFIDKDDIAREIEPSPLVREGEGRVLCPLVPDDLQDDFQYPKLIVSHNDIVELARNLHVEPGGAWQPKDCTSRHEVAIIVPFRNRTSHLRIFLAYMHPFLQEQKLNYRIFVIEQSFKEQFNRAKLFNVGYVEALKYFPYHCFIFHDVDLIPQKQGNMYACTHQPRHMSSSVNTFRYNLPYQDLFGGAVAILQKQFEYVNGFSNVFYGWGGEDDDFQGRIANKGLKVVRFDPRVARYFMLSHAKERPSENRFLNLMSGRERFNTDGLNNLKYSVHKIVHEPLHTNILVEI
ncbi:beta-1,4-N-acetylgalactosaminyltransferase bre-4-like [Bacillus rossius redtenbacheri]|uniref:beta-1,4-N-acetylgalactosaminyltransferase bre-4-like n=1 Tax=Bacillus rossius redtenbacheri TaxID=93214 RepID=UPI002FDD8A9F